MTNTVYSTHKIIVSSVALFMKCNKVQQYIKATTLKAHEKASKRKEANYARSKIEAKYIFFYDFQKNTAQNFHQLHMAEARQ